MIKEETENFPLATLSVNAPAIQKVELVYTYTRTQIREKSIYKLTSEYRFNSSVFQNCKNTTRNENFHILLPIYVYFYQGFPLLTSYLPICQLTAMCEHVYSVCFQT